MSVLKLKDLFEHTTVCDYKLYDLDEGEYLDYSDELADYEVIQISADSDLCTDRAFVLIDIAKNA